MQFLKLSLLIVSLLLLSTSIECKKKKHKSSNSSSKSKTKTKWSTTSELGANAGSSVVATEEHGYYVKRTFLPYNASEAASKSLTSPPYLAIPIAWFNCEGSSSCLQGNAAAISGSANALTEGFLCDDDCIDAYAPVCGKTPNEVAVFYNKCKLNVAKCRTHGLWLDVTYEECKQLYPKETEYTDKKFRSSPYFRDALMEANKEPVVSADEKHEVAKLEQPTEVQNDAVQVGADAKLPEAVPVTKSENTVKKEKAKNENETKPKN